VAIAATSEDSSVGAAAAIASAAREGLIVVRTAESGAAGPPVGKPADASALKVTTVSADKGLLANPDALASATQQFRERLVVAARDVLDHDLALRIASARRVPVLVVEP
jgi:hypothetical protein